MLSARSSEGKQMPARLQYAQALAPYIRVRNAVIPMLAHEAESVGRIGHDSVNGARLQGWKQVQTVPVKDHFFGGFLPLCLPHGMAAPSVGGLW